MTQKPREYAALMLKDLRAWCLEWMDAKDVPAEYRGQVMSHVISSAAKAKYRKKADKIGRERR